MAEPEQPINDEPGEVSGIEGVKSILPTRVQVRYKSLSCVVAVNYSSVGGLLKIHPVGVWDKEKLDEMEEKLLSSFRLTDQSLQQKCQKEHQAELLKLAAIPFDSSEVARLVHKTLRNLGYLDEDDQPIVRARY